MGYDKNSFLAGIAAGRAMKSFPNLEASLGFVYHIDLSYLDTLEYYVYINNKRGNKVLIDWGDGSIDTIIEAIPAYVTHTYTSTGVYRVAIFGAYSHYMDIFGPPECVISIDSPILYPTADRYETGWLDLRGFTHIQRICRGIIKNLSRSGYYFNGVFCTNCSMLESLPDDLFAYIDPDRVATYGFGVDFSGCASLTEIPENLFANSRLFAQQTTAKGIFKGCTSLRRVPKGLFSTYANCTDFREAFRGCTSLEVIEDEVFKGCGAATTFNTTFYDCTSLRAIGNDVFDGCSSVTTFVSCFQNCSSLETVPSSLFDSCVNVTTLSSCFRSSGLVSIPSGLFDSLHLVTTYATCFYACGRLVSVPSSLFDSNTVLTDINYQPFDHCFSNCRAITSSVPELWEKFNYTSITSNRCFYLCENAANYDAIPRNWKAGP